MGVVGVVLAAGAGRRMGGPKALVGGWATPRTPLEETAARLHDGGCPRVLAVIGAEADAVRAAVGTAPPWLRLVEAADWPEGLGASIRAGLRAAGDATVALVSLVDLPDVRADVVARLLATVPLGERTLARAAYRGVPGHPVLIGRAWWPRVSELARGESGARDLFAAEEHLLVECGDLATGRDRDRP
ncbi:MAG: nucleotidyltransferase family protein [Actinobacteria bacterium]|nr:nucleotidyltransferase family protein [Actinomycetota bacterium]